MRNISSWAIRNPVFPLVLFAALSLLGIVSFLRMDVNQMPDISFPAAQVTVVQPGAAPSELETQVTQRVEAAIRGINGVDEIESTAREGSSSTFVRFDIGTPVDRAVNDVRDAIANIRSDLPDGILEPQVERVDAEGGPIAYMAVESTAMGLEELSWYIDNTISKRLLAIPGMANVSRGGGVSREIRIILDPVKMQAQGITAAQVNAQLRQMNLNTAGGRAEIAGSEQSVRVLGNAANAYDLGEKNISVGNGRTIKLSSIATVRDLYAEQRNLALMNGRQVLSFSIEKAKGSSDVTVYDAAAKELDKLEKESGGKFKFRLLFTSVDYTRGQYVSAMEALLEGAALAVLVVFLFLRDFRATVISAVAIPLSAIPTFWFMDLMGFTLNGVTLLALSLVAGVLVDDAIVEIENIVRHMRMGKSAYQAAIDAADEIGLAVVATTFSIVAVFLPVGMMGGLIGQYFKSFGLTIVVAVLTSLAVARLVTPLMAAYFLSAKGIASHGEGWLMDRYMGLLWWSLKHRWKTMLIGVAAFVATIFAFGTLPFTFQPNVNSDYSSVAVEMAPGATLQQTQAVASQAANIIRREPDVLKAFASIRVGGANIYITLNKDRERTSTEFERAVAPKLRNIADARVYFRSQQGFGNRDISVMLSGDDPVKLDQAANALVADMKKMPEVKAPRIEGDLRRPEITIKPRFDLASDMGVTTAALSQTIRIATLGDIDQNSAKFSLSDRQIPIRVALDEGSRQNLSTIENLPVPTANGGSVPLKVVADIGFGAGPTQIQRFNQQRRIVVGADLAPGVVEAMSKIKLLPSYNNLPAGVEHARQGQQKAEQELVTNFLIAVVAGIFLVFAVLVLLYKRIVPPFVNMGSLLLAPLGGAIALHLTGNAMSMPVMIGILMLLGIVAKNSILLIDFAIEEMAKGVEKNEAIADAGHKRAQPIVMTTVAMVAGMLPTAISLSGDGSWRAPMGIVVIGGLILSTVLTLVIVPAGFSLADSFEGWLAPKFGRILTYRPGDKAPLPQPAE
ncbi:MAG: efflux RND transporter permease subunit [Alphaproteobacteria bacterium]|nr:efflux RND transporter permease subunit [Alphaproteobacteria bacterium]MBV9370061.1 efflux RND transporter permease subunit [Alphaproteobacteria bacterium]MBV9900735.1 efflux RND transporter permease subunit [Alphaproteobacteria bacterium]